MCLVLAATSAKATGKIASGSVAGARSDDQDGFARLSVPEKLHQVRLTEAGMSTWRTFQSSIRTKKPWRDEVKIAFATPAKASMLILSRQTIDTASRTRLCIVHADRPLIWDRRSAHEQRARFLRPSVR